MKKGPVQVLTKLVLAGFFNPLPGWILRITEECGNGVRMRELNSVPPIRQVEGKVRQGNNKKKKSLKSKQNREFQNTRNEGHWR